MAVKRNSVANYLLVIELGTLWIHDCGEENCIICRKSKMVLLFPKRLIFSFWQLHLNKISLLTSSPTKYCFILYLVQLQIWTMYMTFLKIFLYISQHQSSYFSLAHLKVHFVEAHLRVNHDWTKIKRSLKWLHHPIFE